MKNLKVTDQELASARREVAYSIIESEQANEILTAIHKLTLLQAQKAAQKKKKGKKHQARAWKTAADELYTITMCAIYTKQDQSSE
jgi:hypothetical protein